MGNSDITTFRLRGNWPTVSFVLTTVPVRCVFVRSLIAHRSRDFDITFNFSKDSRVQGCTQVFLTDVMLDKKTSGMTFGSQPRVVRKLGGGGGGGGGGGHT